MARETKVGLLIGVGVILLIAIIVNDLLVTTGTDAGSSMQAFADQTQADLAPVPPEPVATTELTHHTPQPTTHTPPAGQVPERSHAMDTPRPTPSPLIPTPEEVRAESWRTQTNRNAPPRSVPGMHSAMNLDHTATPDPTTAQEQQAADQRTPQPPRNTRPQLEPEPVERADPEPRPEGSGVIHYVQRGENLSQIARRYYGEDGLWTLIAEANPRQVGERGQVQQGARLRIPNRDAVLATQARAYEEVDVTPRGGRERIVTVEEGDSLSLLADRHLGDESRYREIFELNRDKLRDPDSVTVGMKLRLPGAAADRASAQQRPAAQAEAGDGGYTQYTVQTGDTLTRIARTKLGDPTRYDEIYQANRDVLASADAVAVGQVLRIPRSRNSR